MSKKAFFEYLKTFILTAITATIIVIIIVISMINGLVSEENLKNKVKEKTIDTKMVYVLIQNNLYLATEHPENYKYNLKLGALYESVNDYKNAEIQYKEAIKKVPYHEFKPYYVLAMLYSNTNRLQEAQALMDNLGEKPNKKLVEYKAKVYYQLAEKYYEDADYHEAAFKYKKALEYFDVIKSKKYSKELKGNLASSLVYLADEKVSEIKVDEAIAYLNLAKKYINAPIIDYKLGLLYLTTNPEIANNYFETVFKKEPSLLNYDEYYNLLSELAYEAESQGNYPKAELYKLKIKKLKKYYNENLLSVADISITDASGNISLNKWFRRFKATFNIALKNTSRYKINSLYLYIVFKDGDNIIETFDKQIITENTPLKSQEELPFVCIKTKNHAYIDKWPEKLTVEVYASKTSESRKLLLETLEIAYKQKKTKRVMNQVELFLLKYVYPNIGF